MNQCNITIEGISPLSFSKYIGELKKDKEADEQFEERCWADRCHFDDKGRVFVPAMALKNCLVNAAQFVKMTVQGQGTTKFKSRFEPGILVVDHMLLDGPVTRDHLLHEKLFVPSNGQRGGGKRVNRIFPYVPEGWTTKATIHVLDHMITQSVMERHLEAAGMFVGFLRFRPANGGFYGRWKVLNMEWVKKDE